MRTLRSFLIAGGLAILGGYLVAQGFNLSIFFCAYGGCGEPENAALGRTLFLVGFAITLVWPMLLAKLLHSSGWWARGAVALMVGALGTWLINWPLWAATDSTAAVPPVALALVAGIAPCHIELLGWRASSFWSRRVGYRSCGT